MAELYREGPAIPAGAVYEVRRASASQEALLAGSEAAWGDAAAIAWGPARYETAFRAVWMDAGLAIRFDARDDEPWNTWHDRDDPLWEEEVVELFLDVTGRGVDYAEIEISPANVVCDLHVATPWPDLRSERAWDWEGLETRVLWGQPGGRGQGDWRATGWLPWDGLRSLYAGAEERVPPKAGDRWRFNVFRIKRPGGPEDPERGAIYAAWSAPPEGPSFHAPAAFRAFVFR
jgi:hypothetical protein